MLALVWEACYKSPNFSYRTLNASMGTAARLAISSGMRFNSDDFSAFSSEFKMAYWGSCERFYTEAVEADNISACHALEHSLKRKPWIVKFENNLGSAHRASGRIACGSRFHWDNSYVTVTSFKDSDTLIACAPQRNSVVTRASIKEEERVPEEAQAVSYGDVPPVTRTINNPAKIYRLTREDLCPRQKELVVGAVACSVTFGTKTK